MWLERARAAAQRAPLGHHTHFGGVDVARPAGGDAVDRFEREVRWLREREVPTRFFCGGGWFMDERLAAAVAAAGYADCSATAFPLPWLAPDEPRLGLRQPVWLDVEGARLLELPTTHSLGSLARGFVRLPRGLVHVHFHDWELTDSKRRLAVSVLLNALARRAGVLDLAQATELADHAPRIAFAEAAA